MVLLLLLLLEKIGNFGSARQNKEMFVKFLNNDQNFCNNELCSYGFFFYSFTSFNKIFPTTSNVPVLKCFVFYLDIKGIYLLH